MITGIAFVPQAPALVPEIGRGLDDELRSVREACRSAIHRVAPPGTVLSALGGTSGYDVTPWLLAHSDRELVDETNQEAPTALVVLGDGTACRSEKAPGYLDTRSAGYDAEIGDALRSGDPARLAELDPSLGRELLAAGVPAWHGAAAAIAGKSFSAELLYDDAPFGVGYFVATWMPGPTGRRAEH